MEKKYVSELLKNDWKNRSQNIMSVLYSKVNDELKKLTFSYGLSYNKPG